MEKYLFSVLKKMMEPKYVAYMLLSFIPLILIPFVKHFFNSPQWVILSLAALFIPVVSYFIVTGILFLIYAIQIAKNHPYIWASRNQNIQVFSVKVVSRTLNISPRAAFFMLELASRTNEFTRSGTSVLNFKYQ